MNSITEVDLHEINQAHQLARSDAECATVLVMNGSYHTLKDRPGENYDGVSIDEIATTASKPAAKEKQHAPCVIFSTYRAHDGRVHEAQAERGEFIALPGDIDQGNPHIAAVDAALVAVFGDVHRIIYSTASAMPENRKWRFIIPLAEPIPGDCYASVQSAAFDLMHGQSITCDGALARPGQVAYLPNVPPDRRASDGEPLFYDSMIKGSASFSVSGSTVEARMIEMARAAEEAHRAAQEAARARSATRRTKVFGSSLPDVIDAYNGDVRIADLLEQYGYRHAGIDWQSPYQSSGSYATRIMGDGDAWVSLSESDAAAGLGSPGKHGGCWGDAFDLFAHYEHGGDQKEALAAAAQSIPLTDGRTLDQARRDEWLLQQNSGTLPGNVPAHAEEWPEPVPLPGDLLPVPAFPDDLLPDRLRPWVSDIAERVQCAPEFVAVPVMVALGSLIGRRVGIRPQAQTDWTETPNLWGCIVGRPGVLKSPAMNAALAPLERLGARAREEHKAQATQGEAESVARELHAKLAKREAEGRLKKDRGADVSELLKPPEDISTPPARRYSTHDTSYQALAELLMQNPNGLLVTRDELVSLLASLDAEDNAEGRGFYLSGWDGKQSYTVDRIGRGLNRHVEAVCLSLIGGTQPGKLASYINAANRGGAGDDGLIQRFGLLVWPDQGGEWRNVDRWPDHAAKREAFEVFDHLDGLTPETIGAERDKDYMGEPDGLPFLRFAADALEAFTEWRTDLERRILRGGDTPPALESHFAKYRKHVPALALICHLADGGSGAVTLEATLRAVAWADYLMPHAQRAYGSGPARALQAAQLILKRIRSRALPDAFAARDVYRKQWAGLSERDTVREGLALLEDHDYLATRREATGGAPSTVYLVNPRAHQ